MKQPQKNRQDNFLHQILIVVKHLTRLASLRSLTHNSQTLTHITELDRGIHRTHPRKQVVRKQIQMTLPKLTRHVRK